MTHLVSRQLHSPSVKRGKSTTVQTLCGGVDPGPICRWLRGMARRNVISESEISMSGLLVTGAAADKSECAAAAITSRYLTSSTLHAGHGGGLTETKYKCNI